MATSLGFAVVVLVAAGISQITAEATGMAIVQLQAPEAQRGRIIGTYSIFGPGMRTFSGITVGVLGSFVGIPIAVLLGGVFLIAGILCTAWFVRNRRPTQGFN